MPISIDVEYVVLLERSVINKVIQWNILRDKVSGMCNLGALEMLLQLKTTLSAQLVCALHGFVLSQMTHLALRKSIIGANNDCAFVCMCGGVSGAKVIAIVVERCMAVVDGAAWVPDSNAISNND